MRKLINELPFDRNLFRSFIKDAILNGNFDRSDFWEPMRLCVLQKYNLKIWRWFYGWCEYYYKLVEKGVSIDDFYNLMLNIPESRINKVIGAGSDGIVLDICNKAVKVFYDDEICSCLIDFYTYCKNNETSTTPKVYKIRKRWVMMEKLKTHTNNCWHLIKSSELDVQGKSIEFYWAKQKNVDTSIFNKDQLFAYNWIIECKNNFKQVGNRYFDEGLGDFNINNIGERDNGDIVLFDP